MPGNEAKPPVAVIDPELVRILEIVGDVEVGRAVAVEIREYGRESEILRLLLQRLPLCVREARIVRYGLADEVPRAVVQVEEVRIGALYQAEASQISSIHHLVVLAVWLAHLIAVRPESARDPIEAAFLGRDAVDRRIGLVIGDIQIEVAVPVDVCDRDRHAARPVSQSPAFFREVAFPVVHKNGIGPAQGDEDQVLIAIAIDVRKRAARGMAIPRRQAGARGDILEPPVAQVAIQDAWTFGTGQKDIGPSVAIHVRQADASPLRELPIVYQRGIADGVAERDAGPRGIQQCEAGRESCRRHIQPAPAVSRFLMPHVWWSCRSGASACGNEQREEERSPQLSTSPHTRAAVRSEAPRPSATIRFAALPALLRAAGS